MMKYDQRPKADRSDKTVMFYFKMLLPDLKMIYSELITPIARALYSILEHISYKIVLLLSAGGISEILHLQLFNTPSMWWKGLLYLVIIDWASGVIIAIIDGRFSWSVMNEKWRQIIGYVASCAMAAILANAFPNVFYYFQFLIYISFFVKEGISILETYNLLAWIQVVREKLSNGNSLMDGNLNEDVKERAKSNSSKSNIKMVEKEPYE